MATKGQWLVTARDPFETGLVGYRLKRKYNLPFHLQIHTDFLNSYFKRESFLNKIRVLLAKFLIPRADHIRVVSERIKNSLVLNLKIKNSKITILPVFVDIEKIKQTFVKTDLHQKYLQFDFIILMASRLTKEKNIGLAIEAMVEIIKKFPKTGLIIVGSGPEEKNLKFKIKNLKLHDNIVLEPWTDDIISYYKTADLFLLTSNYEGYGMTIIEATAAGCIVVSSDVGIAYEVLDKENIFPVGDKKELENKLEKAIKKELKLSQKLITKTKNEYLKEYKNILNYV
jgi:1,2-diacylglycerol 3-alpha-glucosyltransferase